MKPLHTHTQTCNHALIPCFWDIIMFILIIWELDQLKYLIKYWCKSSRFSSLANPFRSFFVSRTVKAIYIISLKRLTLIVCIYGCILVNFTSAHVFRWWKGFNVTRKPHDSPPDTEMKSESFFSFVIDDILKVISSSTKLKGTRQKKINYM